MGIYSDAFGYLCFHQHVLTIGNLKTITIHYPLQLQLRSPLNEHSTETYTLLPKIQELQIEAEKYGKFTTTNSLP